MKHSKELPNVFGIADDILVVHYDRNGPYHGSITNVQKSDPNI